MSKQTKMVLVTFGILITMALVSAVLFPGQLSPTKIDTLRTDYPVYAGATEDIQMAERTLGTVVQEADAYVIAEILEAPEEQTASAKAADSLAQDQSYIEIRIIVLEKIFCSTDCNSLEEGQEVVLSIPSDEFETCPQYVPGMRCVCSLHSAASQDLPWEYSGANVGFYYIVEGGFVLSAYPESEGYEYSGYRLSTFMKAIDAIRDET